MGLSASQARLLSITARLTNNELQSQLITSAKMRLADKSDSVSETYNDALASTKLQFQYYDDNGKNQTYDLTPKFLYSYEPLKNQYAIKNASSDKYLVNELDSTNYEKSNSLNEFLDCYNLLDDVQDQKTATITNPDYTDWEAKYKQWVENEPKIENYTKTTKVPTGNAKLVHENSLVYDELVGISCFGPTKDGFNCFMHVLSALIGEGEHKTSSGNTFNVVIIPDDGPWNWNTCTQEEINAVQARESLKTDDCSNEAYEGKLVTEKHGTVPCKGTGEDAAKYNNGTTDGTGYCYQKAVDLLWEVHDTFNSKMGTGGYATLENLQKFWYFIEFDLGTHRLEQEYTETTETDTDAYNKAHETWKNSEPVEPPKTIEKVVDEKYVTINDIPKGQWYVNLWYIMNGSKTANKIRQKEVTLTDGSTKTLNVAQAAAKSTATSPAYTVLDSKLISDGSWIKYALANGIITLVQAQYSDPSEESERATEIFTDGYNWQDIGYENTKDIISVEDTTKIKEAEQVYENGIKDVENKDNEYDRKLRNLETEHNALKTEYDTVKSVIDKNIQRSYKSFLS